MDVINSGINPDYVPDLALPAGITATGDAAEAAKGAEVVVLAVTAQTLRASLTQWAPLLAGDTVLVSLMKGIEKGTAFENRR